MAVHAHTSDFRVGAWAVVGIAIAFVPIVIAAIPPLADYPNHLARVHILSNLPRVPELAAYYRDVTSAQPNLAFDFVVGLLSRVMPLETAGKAFLALTILAMVGGTYALHRALHARASVWPFLSLLFVYNRLFLWGFVAYLFTLGCALAACAGWVALRGQPVIRLIAATVLATLLYLGHLYAFGVYALCIAGYELTVLWDRRRDLRRALAAAAMAAVQFAPAVYLFLFVSPTSGAAGATEWGPMWRKVAAPLNLLHNYHLAFDAACLALLAAVVLVGLLRRNLTFNRFMAAPLALLSITFLLMPDELFSSYGADKRLPIAIALVAIAASEWRAWSRLTAVALAALFVVRVALIAEVWAQSNGVYSNYLAAIDRVPYGAKLLVVVAHPSQISLPPIPAFEIANLAIVYRRAFVPSLFTFPREAGQAVAFSPDMQNLVKATPYHIVRPDDLTLLNDPDYARRAGPFRPELVSQYDCVLIINGRHLPIPPPDGEPLYEGPDVVLLKVNGVYAEQAS
ncbi:hypothetical protein [Nitrospira moscoviensis]|uniref:Glycosyltransferase RgtA/B/C/D-like domain-containing protein n=1 Tax=Nitrospira moscoviensis TaxID=42253 RepID=A0A0K2GDP3_NITMO|nr:hypothetical protein [Nitrospira moscoviensis]ALA59076.1 Conserved membrane protein of unknown function [Nitrospira moscoviensis]